MEQKHLVPFHKLDYITNYFIYSTKVNQKAIQVRPCVQTDWPNILSSESSWNSEFLFLGVSQDDVGCDKHEAGDSPH